jgi:hypothetical protein
MESFNIVTYLIYLPITFYITIGIGKDLNQKGEVYLMRAFHQQTHLVQSVNKFLLIGYYLINLGYAVISINFFGSVDSWLMAFESIAFRLGALLIGLGLLHYFNLYAFAKFSKNIQQIFQIN